MKKQFSCAIEYTLSYIGGKWKPIILWHLGEEGTFRYNSLKRLLDGISHKMLAQQLKELEQDGLIERKEYPQIPPRVEYSISEKGKTIMPILNAMCVWGKKDIMLNEESLL